MQPQPKDQNLVPYLSRGAGVRPDNLRPASLTLAGHVEGEEGSLLPSCEKKAGVPRASSQVLRKLCAYHVALTLISRSRLADPLEPGRYLSPARVRVLCPRPITPDSSERSTQPRRPGAQLGIGRRDSLPRFCRKEGAEL